VSLSAWEKQSLDSMEDKLAESDPGLATLLAGFTRLASGEEMPVRETIRPSRRQAAYRLFRKRRHPRMKRKCRHTRQPYERLGWWVPLLWLVLVIALIAVALVLSRSDGKGPCTGSRPPVCAGQAWVSPSAGT
jgi:hypothetical protein